MHSGGLGKTRQERVQQVIDREESVNDFASYVPIGNSVAKLRIWSDQGAEIAYMTFHKKPSEVEIDMSILDMNKFPKGPILFRQDGQHYGTLAESIMPDVLIEDDCESIGGQPQTVSAKLTEEARCKIMVISVKEFAGIDHLPDSLSDLENV